MLKRVFLVITLAICFVSFVNAEAVDVKHFLLYPSISGESGYIYNPSAYVLGNNMFGMGLHPFVFKLNYGLFDILEPGIVFDFGSSPNLVDVLKNGHIFLKYMGIKEEDYFVTLAAGVRQIPVNIFAEKKENDFTAYSVAAKKIDDYNISFGIKKDFSGKSTDKQFIRLMADACKVINDTMLLTAEYDGQSFNAGLKISLNYNINIDMFVKQVEKFNKITELGDLLRNYFVFGITYIQ